MIKAYWQEYKANTKNEINENYACVVSFGMDAKTCEAAVERILTGEMRCRIYPEDGYHKSLNGKACIGDKNIIVDWKGVPRAVVQLTCVRTIPVSELTNEICALEAMAPDLTAWTEKRLPIIKTEVEELSGEFSENTMLTIEEFKLVYPTA